MWLQQNFKSQEESSLKYRSVNDFVLLDSHLLHFFQEVHFVLYLQGLLGVQVVQVDPQGSLNRRPKDSRYLDENVVSFFLSDKEERHLTFRFRSERSAAFP